MTQKRSWYYNSSHYWAPPALLFFTHTWSWVLQQAARVGETRRESRIRNSNKSNLSRALSPSYQFNSCLQMQRSSSCFSSKQETLKNMILSWQWWWLYLLRNMEFHKRKPRLVFTLLVCVFVISSFIYYHDRGHELVVLHPQCHCKMPFMNLNVDISNQNTTCSEVSSF